MIKILSTLFLIFSTLSLFAQFQNYNTENDQWFKGRVVTLEGQVIQGEFNYNFISEVLRRKNKDKIEVITPNKVQFFELNSAENEVAIFYCLPYQRDYSTRMVPTFFRLLHQEGEYAILSKHSFFYKQKEIIQPRGYSLDHEYYEYEIEYYNIEKVYETVFIANNIGTIKPFLKRKKSKKSDFWEVFFTNKTNESGLAYSEEKLDNSSTLNNSKKFRYENREALKAVLNHEKYKVFIEHVKFQNLDLTEIDDLKNAFGYIDNFE